MEKKNNKNSQEFKESKQVLDMKKELVELQMKCDRQKHEMKVRELEMVRANDTMRHEKEMERQRIKSAEIRRTMMRKGDQFRR
jgi:hypothetical protein